MAKIFVSYSRSDKPKVKKLIPLLREYYGVENVWWDQNFYGGQVWWNEIKQQIAHCDVFVYLMSPRSLGSPYCLAELEEARRLRKQILYANLRRNTNIPDTIAQTHYIHLTGRINRATVAPLVRSINEYASRPVSNLAPLTPQSVDLPMVPTSEPRNVLADYAAQIGIAVIATLIGGVLLALIIQADRFDPTRNDNQGDVALAGTPSTTRTRTAEEIAHATQTQAALDFQETLDASNLTEAAIERLTATAFAPTQEAQRLATVDAILTATQAAVLTANAPTATPTETATATPTNTPTATNTPTITPTQSPEQIAQTPQPSNAAWEPYITERDFDGVTMVLVPAGCFMMGSDDGDSDEQPIHEQCFDEPFWIDKYEVTNADYGSTGCETWSSDPDQPRNCLDWFEASDFCEAREARLPTEAEWEYAARGPDSLVYPWGNEYDAALVIGEDDPTYGDTRTAPVGSRPGGTSWVGALDMSGNVWEWTSSLYEDYPYSDDHENINDDTNRRVIRGGAFDSTADNLRAAYRSRLHPSNDFNLVGFRCVRPPSL